ncbi:MAG: (2Fe-2S) ferredoxin domain-containing protein [Crocosphaera sp.]
MNDQVVTSSSISGDRTILVCQGRCCRKDGSTQLLAAFQSQTPENIKIVPCGCLGQCGNGPNIVVLPDKIFYQRIYPQDIPTIFNHINA